VASALVNHSAARSGMTIFLTSGRRSWAARVTSARSGVPIGCCSAAA